MILTFGSFKCSATHWVSTSTSGCAYSVAFSSVAGNPVSRILLGEVADRAQTGTAETHLVWGVELTRQGKFPDSEAQLRAAVTIPLADWATRANAALADLFIAWGQSLVANKQF